MYLSPPLGIAVNLIATGECKTVMSNSKAVLNHSKQQGILESIAEFWSSFFLSPQPDSIEPTLSGSIYLCWLSGKLLSGFSCSVDSIVGFKSDIPCQVKTTNYLFQLLCVFYDHRSSQPQQSGSIKCCEIFRHNTESFQEELKNSFINCRQYMCVCTLIEFCQLDSYWLLDTQSVLSVPNKLLRNHQT